MSACRASLGMLARPYRLWATNVSSQRLISTSAQRSRHGLSSWQWSIPRPNLESTRWCSSCESTTPASHPTKTEPADHRDLGAAQKLFVTSNHSPGSPLFRPAGADVFNKLVDFLRAQYPLWGFRQVVTPTMYKSGLWRTSGHWENYSDDMFRVSPPNDGDGKPDGGDEPYGLKPMNCPGHCLLYATEPRSWRDLPIRYADFSPLHRNELSGALSGLVRVRRFHQDDGHIFCTPSQVESEISAALAFMHRVYSVVGLGDAYSLALSTRPAENSIGSDSEWADAEEQLKTALQASGREWTTKEGDGAFYGPKIDVLVRDRQGKIHQTATIQLDFQLPRRFQLEYLGGDEQASAGPEATSEVSEAKTTSRPVMIHRAIFGSLERFMGLLIEHYAGSYPFWLTPRPVTVVTVSNDATTLEYARYVRDVLAGNVDMSGTPSQSSGRHARYSVRPTHSTAPLHVELESSNRPLSVKIAHVLADHRPGFVVVVGKRDAKSQTINLRVGKAWNKAGWTSSSDEIGVDVSTRSEETAELISRLQLEGGQTTTTPAAARRLFERLISEWR